MRFNIAWISSAIKNFTWYHSSTRLLYLQNESFMLVLWRIQKNCSAPTSCKMENSSSLTPRIITYFNYMDWRGDMWLLLNNKGLYRFTMGKEVKPHQALEKLKYLTKLDEDFGFISIHISGEFIFHLHGLKNLREVWLMLELLFGNKYELRGHILENELISLQPSNFVTIQQLFTKVKYLVVQCK